MFNFRTVVIILGINLSALAQQYTVTTIAGGAAPPAPMSALNASIGIVSGITADSLGNIYFVSGSAFSVFKVNSSGTLTVVAGNGRPGYSGDGGPATSATLLGPTGVAVDGSGNIYITDVCWIRKVSSTGTISTIAGNGNCGSYVDGGQATSGPLFNPTSPVVDSGGNLLFADSSTSRVAKLSPSGIITTIAGTGTSGFSGDGGSATGAQLSHPHGVALDSSGNTYIADTGNSRIRKVSSTG